MKRTDLKIPCGVLDFKTIRNEGLYRRETPNFERLFSGLWLGEHPPENRNRYLVLPLDFSKVGVEMP